VVATVVVFLRSRAKPLFFSMNRNQRHHLWSPFVAGGLGDATACLISHPMDVAKVRLQLKGELSSLPQPTGIRNIFHTLITIYQKDGFFKGIYIGLSAAILRQLTFSSLRHGTFHFLQTNWSIKYQQPMPLTIQIFSGACVGAVCAMIANPCDVVLIRMQADGHWPISQQRAYRNVFHGFSSIISSEGFSCLWRGYRATVIRGVLVTCSQLPSYHTSKYYLLRSGYFAEPSLVPHLLASIISAIVASLVTCPADVIKTRLMNMKKEATATSPSGASTRIVYDGVIDCFQRIYQTEGMRGFYKGLGATIGRLGPHTIILWQTQELILKALERE
jgi:hypothetical protein